MTAKQTKKATKRQPLRRTKKPAKTKKRTKRMTAPTPKVYVLRTSDATGKSHNDFQWPESGLVEAPDWQPTVECGHGLHGLLWGIGDYSLTRLTDPKARWQVVEVDAYSIVEISGKVKFPRGIVVYSGALPGAMSLIAEKRLLHLAAESAKLKTKPDQEPPPASTSGNAAPASTSGKLSTACCLGLNGEAKAGEQGSIIMTWWDDAAKRFRHVVGYVGEDGIKSGVTYVVRDGKLAPKEAA